MSFVSFFLEVVRAYRSGLAVSPERYLRLWHEMVNVLSLKNAVSDDGLPTPQSMDEIFGGIFRQLKQAGCCMPLLECTENVVFMFDAKEAAGVFNSGATVAIVQTGGHFTPWVRSSTADLWTSAPEWSFLSQQGPEALQGWVCTRVSCSISSEQLRSLLCAEGCGIYVIKNLGHSHSGEETAAGIKCHSGAAALETEEMKVNKDSKQHEGAAAVGNPLPAQHLEFQTSGKLPNLNSCALDCTIMIASCFMFD
mmetsp:Transcript_26716/g.52658  ORF Transcript_26716/g.52658 Transcript_26716/m.52658 type:complete len:252 (+) Transcript_26716:61-816(+)